MNYSDTKIRTNRSNRKILKANGDHEKAKNKKLKLIPPRIKSEEK